MAEKEAIEERIQRIDDKIHSMRKIRKGEVEESEVELFFDEEVKNGNFDI